MGKNGFRKRFSAVALTLSMAAAILFAAPDVSEVKAEGGGIAVEFSYTDSATGFMPARHAITVTPDISEYWGYDDYCGGEKPTVYDAIVAALFEMFEGGLTDYFSAGDYGYINDFMGRGYNVVYFVNGEMPSVGAGEYILADGDVVEMYAINDSYGMDTYAWFELGGEKTGAVTAGAGVPIELELNGINSFMYGAEYGAFDTEFDEVDIYAIETYDGGNGEPYGDFSGVLATTDGGAAALAFDTPGVYYISAVGEDEYETPILSPWLTITITDDGAAAASTGSGYRNAPNKPGDPGSPSVGWQTALSETLAFIAHAQAAAPEYGDEWEVLTLARGGYEAASGYYERYYDSVLSKLQGGALPAVTDCARLSLALTAVGVNASNVDGKYNLISQLTDASKYTGLNAAVYALLAIDAKPYDVSKTAKNAIIKYILDKEVAGGGFNWGYGGAADPDMTAMAIQALAPYKNETAAAAAIARGLPILGGSFDGAETNAQVITALAALGQDPTAYISPMLAYYNDGGGFKSSYSGSLNNMSTQQGGYALVAYSRYMGGQTPLYDMSDCDVRLNVPPAQSSSPSPGGTQSPGGSAEPSSPAETVPTSVSPSQTAPPASSAPAAVPSVHAPSPSPAAPDSPAPPVNTPEADILAAQEETTEEESGAGAIDARQSAAGEPSNSGGAPLDLTVPDASLGRAVTNNGVQYIVVEGCGGVVFIFDIDGSPLGYIALEPGQTLDSVNIAEIMTALPGAKHNPKTGEGSAPATAYVIIAFALAGAAPALKRLAKIKKTR